MRNEIYKKKMSAKSGDKVFENLYRKFGFRIFLCRFLYFLYNRKGRNFLKEFRIEGIYDSFKSVCFFMRFFLRSRTRVAVIVVVVRRGRIRFKMFLVYKVVFDISK